MDTIDFYSYKEYLLEIKEEEIEKEKFLIDVEGRCWEEYKSRKPSVMNKIKQELITDETMFKLWVIFNKSLPETYLSLVLYRLVYLF